jgi:hypothetical protein
MLFTAIAAIAVAAGIWIAWHELRQTRRNTILQLIDSTASYLRSDEALEALRSIYDLTPEQVTGLKLNPQQIRVLETIETLGEMVNEKLVGDPKPVVRMWAGVLALRCWYQLHDYIKRQRDERGTIYCENLEDLARRTIRYVREERPNQVWVQIKKVNIIAEIEKNHNLWPITIDERRHNRDPKSLL